MNLRISKISLRLLLPILLLSLTLTKSYCQVSMQKANTKNTMKRIVETLSSDSLDKRAIGTNALTQASLYLVKEFQTIGLLPISGFQKFFDTFKFQTKTSFDSASNIVGIIPGTDSTSGIIIISAHYDVNRRYDVFVDGKYSIDNGMNDNASGVSMMLALAELMISDSIKPKRSLIFLATCAQDLNYAGTRHFLNLFVDRKAIRYNINFDAVGIQEENKMYFTGIRQSSFVAELIERSIKMRRKRKINFTSLPVDDPLDAEYIKIAERNSDHLVFEDAGIPATSITSFADFRNTRREANEKLVIDYTFMDRALALLYQTIQPLLRPK